MQANGHHHVQFLRKMDSGLPQTLRGFFLSGGIWTRRIWTTGPPGANPYRRFRVVQPNKVSFSTHTIATSLHSARKGHSGASSASRLQEDRRIEDMLLARKALPRCLMFPLDVGAQFLHLLPAKWTLPILHPHQLLQPLLRLLSRGVELPLKFLRCRLVVQSRMAVWAVKFLPGLPTILQEGFRKPNYHPATPQHHFFHVLDCRHLPSPCPNKDSYTSRTQDVTQHSPPVARQ